MIREAALNRKRSRLSNTYIDCATDDNDDGFSDISNSTTSRKKIKLTTNDVIQQRNEIMSQNVLLKSREIDNQTRKMELDGKKIDLELQRIEYERIKWKEKGELKAELLREERKFNAERLKAEREFMLELIKQLKSKD